MQQALDALEMHVLGFDGVRKMELAIEALEVELAKPDPRKEWIGLTDDEIDKCDRNSIAGADSLFGRRFYKAIEAIIKERNT
jgi:hypothetical protein